MKKIVSLLSALAVIGSAGSFSSFAAGETHHVRIRCDENISYDIGYQIGNDDFEYFYGSVNEMPFGDSNESDLPAQQTYVTARRINNDASADESSTIYESEWGDFKDDILIRGNASIVNDPDMLMVINSNEDAEEPAKTEFSTFLMRRVFWEDDSALTVVGLTDYCFSCQPEKNTVYLMDDDTMRIHMGIGNDTFSFCTNNEIILRSEDGESWDVYAYLRDQGREVKIVKGDVNCDGSIDAADASAVLEAYALISTDQREFAFVTERFADYNEDGSIDAADASAILEYYAMVSTSSK